VTYDSLVDHSDHLSAHYLAEVLPKDLKAKDGHGPLVHRAG
jgi:hypothetical protein